jgi:hypothetical protein
VASVGVAELRRYKLIERTADNIFLLTAEHSLGCWIEENNVLFCIDGNNSIHCRVN